MFFFELVSIDPKNETHFPLRLSLNLNSASSSFFVLMKFVLAFFWRKKKGAKIKERVGVERNVLKASFNLIFSSCTSSINVLLFKNKAW